MKIRHPEGIIEDSNVNIRESHPKINQTSLEQQENSLSEWSNKRIGGFWIKKDISGNKYLSGLITFEEGKAECFHIFNNRLEGKRLPDKVCYRLSGDSEREEVGAFWIKANQKGRKYLSGVIRRPNGDKKSLHIYMNDFKQGDQPPYNCFCFGSPL